MAKEILIVDSDVADQEEFKTIFDPSCYQLAFSENGEEALFRVRRFKPDLVISAMTLGEKTGLELCEALKSNPQLADVPFILLTEIFEDISEKDRRRVPLDGILSKPFERSEILDLADQLLKGGTGGEEEIIDLFEVVEEPEPKMSIDDLFATDREITSPEPPESLLKGKPSEGEISEAEKLFFHEETERKQEEIELPLKEEVSGDRLPEEIELDEILREAEELKPTLEEEKPGGKEVGAELKQPFLSEPPPEDMMTLEEFEIDLKTPIAAEVKGGDLKGFLFEGPKGERPAKSPPREAALEEELSLFEESFRESTETAPAEVKSAGTEKKVEAEVAEELTLLEESFEESKAPPSIETPSPESAGGTGIPEELVLFEEPLEELKAQPVAGMSPTESVEEISVEEEELSQLSEEEFPEALLEEVLKKEEIGFAGMQKERETGMAEKPGAPAVSGEATGPLVGVGDRKIEEIITKGLQDMMEDFITKVVPEMAQNVIALTVGRIEKMVKEMVPELTEKAIQEEIKRLRKGEKD